MRREWKQDFQQRGVEGTRRRVEISAYHSDEKKMKAARRWLWWQDHGLTVISIALAAIVVPGRGGNTVLASKAVAVTPLALFHCCGCFAFAG